MKNDFEYLSDKEFEDLKKTFYSQAYEIIEDLQDEVINLEEASDPEPLGTALKTIRRYFHTLKGDSNSFGITSVGNLCHRIEDMLSCLNNGSAHKRHEAIELLLGCIDTLNKLLVESESGDNRVRSSEFGVVGSEHGTDIKEIVGRIDSFLSPEFCHSRESGNPETMAWISASAGMITEYQELQMQEALKNSLNVYEAEVIFHPMCGEKSVAAFMVAQQLNSMGQIIHSAPDMESSAVDNADRIIFLLSSGLSKDEIKRDVFIAGITGEININNYHSSESTVRSSEKLTTPNCKSELLRIEASKVDTIMNLVGELIIGRSMIEQIAADIENNMITTDIAERLIIANSYMERTVSDLQRGAMKMRMVPLNHVFRKFPKMVRELSVDKGKQIKLSIEGKETELDKSIVDAIGEPLAHIIRNFIDHGIEEPSHRKSIGKPEEGVITLKAYHEAAQIVIEASDDGRGINTYSLKKKAVEKGFISHEEAEKLSDTDAVNLIFLSGLSTSETISETCGRGIGMDVVKSAIENMKGSIEVESIQMKGTRFRLRLPLTLAIIKALMFEVGEKLYAIPISAVAEVTRITKDSLTTVDGKDTLLLRDRIISIIRLEELFKVKGQRRKKKFIIILAMGKKRIGLLADRLARQQELVIKAIDRRYSQAGLISGASILGNGQVTLILDVHAVFKKVVEDEKKRMAAA